MEDSILIIDEAYLFFDNLSLEDHNKISHYLTKLRFAGSGDKRKFHIYELQGNTYIDTGRVEEWTYEEYLEWHRSTEGGE